MRPTYWSTHKTTLITVAVITCILLIFTLCIYGMMKRSQRGQAANKWAESPGTSGFINLDEIQKASLENQKTEDFEKRVNEIFEGDNLVLLDVQGKQNGFVLTGVEDLNGNEQPDAAPGAGDEVVFQMTVSGSGPKNATLVGAGVNRDFTSRYTYPMPNIDRNYAQNYYRQHGYYPYYSHYYYYPGYRYYTPRRRYGYLRTYRTTYRTSPRYRTQIGRNNTYMSGYRTRYPNSSKTFSKPSSTRANYVKKTSSSPGFKSRVSSSSTMKARSGMSSSGSRTSSSSGGFRSGLSSSRSSSSRSSGFGSSRSSSSRSYGSSRSSSGFGIF